MSSSKPNFKADIAGQIGADYISNQKVPTDELAKHVGNIDLIYEAVGEGHLTFDVMRVLGINDLLFDNVGGNLFMTYYQRKETLARAASGALASLGLTRLP